MREAFAGFGVSRKRDSFWVPACVGLEMLDQQRGMRAKASSSVSSAWWIQRLWLPLLWKLSQGKPSQYDEITIALLMSHVLQKWVAGRALFPQNTLSYCLFKQGQVHFKMCDILAEGRYRPTILFLHYKIPKALKKRRLFVNSGTKLIWWQKQFWPFVCCVSELLPISDTSAVRIFILKSEFNFTLQKELKLPCR